MRPPPAWVRCLGTSTVTTFVESSTGISEGARTGLSSVVTGLLFLLACVLAPIAGIIPSAATAPALIIVGMFMIGNVAKIDWKDPEVALPCFLTIAMMPFAYSISDGIGFGIISYTRDQGVPRQGQGGARADVRAQRAVRGHVRAQRAVMRGFPRKNFIL